MIIYKNSIRVDKNLRKSESMTCVLKDLGIFSLDQQQWRSRNHIFTGLLN